MSLHNASRILNKSLNKWYAVESCLLNNRLTGSQLVRWTKPRWVPKAESKKYVVTHRKRLPPDETAEMFRLYNNYRNYLRNTQEHCKRENDIKAELKEHSALAIEKDEEEHRLLMEFNEKENQRVAQLRKERQEKEKEDLIKAIMEHKAREEERELKHLEESYKKLKETQELVKLFIEREDLETVISRAIDNPIDYNFAIDLEGRKYEGRLTQPHKVDLDSLPVFEVKDKAQGFTNEF